MKKNLFVSAILLLAMLFLGSCSEAEMAVPEKSYDDTADTRWGDYYCSFHLWIESTWLIDGSAVLKWNNIGDEINGSCGYKVMRSTNNGGFTHLGTVNSWYNTTYTDRAVQYGNKYEYQVLRGWWNIYGEFVITERSFHVTYYYGYTDPGTGIIKPVEPVDPGPIDLIIDPGERRPS